MLLHLLKLNMDKMIKLHFPKLACFERVMEPASVSVPFPKGKLYNIEHCKIVNKSGKCFPAQFRPTALWPDGSVKWLLVHSLSFAIDSSVFSTRILCG